MKVLAAVRVPENGFFFFSGWRQAVLFFRRVFHLSAGRRRGFTLLELLVVLAILAVLCSFTGIGLLRGMPERRLMSASRELYGGLRRAQSRAVSTGTRMAVEFSPETGTFSLLDQNDYTLSSTSLPADIELYRITGDSEKENRYFFNSRGIKTGVSGSVAIRYRKPGYPERRVVVRPTGSMTIQRSLDNGKTWE